MDKTKKNPSNPISEKAWFRLSPWKRIQKILEYKQKLPDDKESHTEALGKLMKSSRCNIKKYIDLFKLSDGAREKVFDLIKRDTFGDVTIGHINPFINEFDKNMMDDFINNLNEACEEKRNLTSGGFLSSVIIKQIAAPYLEQKLAKELEKFDSNETYIINPDSDYFKEYEAISDVHFKWISSDTKGYRHYRKNILYEEPDPNKILFIDKKERPYLIDYRAVCPLKTKMSLDNFKNHSIESDQNTMEHIWDNGDKLCEWWHSNWVNENPEQLVVVLQRIIQLMIEYYSFIINTNTKKDVDKKNKNIDVDMEDKDIGVDMEGILNKLSLYLEIPKNTINAIYKLDDLNINKNTISEADVIKKIYSILRNKWRNINIIECANMLAILEKHEEQEGVKACDIRKKIEKKLNDILNDNISYNTIYRRSKLIKIHPNLQKIAETGDICQNVITEIQSKINNGANIQWGKFQQKIKIAKEDKCNISYANTLKDSIFDDSFIQGIIGNNERDETYNVQSAKEASATRQEKILSEIKENLAKKNKIPSEITDILKGVQKYHKMIMGDIPLHFCKLAPNSSYIDFRDKLLFYVPKKGNQDVYQFVAAQYGLKCKKKSILILVNTRHNEYAPSKISKQELIFIKELKNINNSDQPTLKTPNSHIQSA